MVGGTLLAYLGGLHYWWPKMTGKLYSEPFAKISALIVFVGFNLTFFPQFILGYMGMPRRYHAYPAIDGVAGAERAVDGRRVDSRGRRHPAGALPDLLVVQGAATAGPNPWGAKGLEWETASPPPIENFPVTPIVTSPAYAYTNEDAHV